MLSVNVSASVFYEIIINFVRFKTNYKPKKLIFLLMLIYDWNESTSPKKTDGRNKEENWRVHAEIILFVFRFMTHVGSDDKNQKSNEIFSS